MRRTALILTFVFATSAVATMAMAELPAVDTLLGDVGFSAAEIADVKAGKIVTGSAPTAHERDLASAFAFFVPTSPAELVKELKDGLMGKVDPNEIARGKISGPGTIADFAAMTLSPDAEKRAKRYVSAKGGDDLNLSSDEISAFDKLGASAAVGDVEAQVRAALLARYQAYHGKGLAGILPYDRGGGASRSVADDLRKSFETLKNLKKYAPAAYAAMLNYPGSQPAGAEDSFTWVHLKAHDVPTIVLTQGLFVPDGDAYLVLQRQFYVSEGFNCEQAVAGFLPAQGGTVVVYSNHTSTDQVAGFGGGAKRSIGSKLMASELEGIFTKLQKSVK
jgi:hypothetical protein